MLINALIVPLIIFFLVIIFLVPGPSTWRNMSKEALIRWKLWELNVAALGLALTHVTSQLLTQGTKNVAGKPRPDMLARCMPDINNIGNYYVGGYGQDISPRWIMVDQTVCTQTNKNILDDGFRSFPSGHATSKQIYEQYQPVILTRYSQPPGQGCSSFPSG